MHISAVAYTASFGRTLVLMFQCWMDVESARNADFSWVEDQAVIIANMCFTLHNMWNLHADFSFSCSFDYQLMVSNVNNVTNINMFRMKQSRVEIIVVINLSIGAAKTHKRAHKYPSPKWFKQNVSYINQHLKSVQMSVVWWTAWNRFLKCFTHKFS